MTLPILVEFSGSAEEFQFYLDSVYALFKRSFIDAKFVFMGKPVSTRRQPEYDGKHHGFWHVVSQEGSEPGEENRNICLRRCERIEWIGYVLQNVTDKELVSCWISERQTSRGRSAKRYHLYLENERYLVVLEERENYFLLITAYVVDREHSHLKLLKSRKDSQDPRG